MPRTSLPKLVTRAFHLTKKKCNAWIPHFQPGLSTKDPPIFCEESSPSLGRQAFREKDPLDAAEAAPADPAVRGSQLRTQMNNNE